MRAILFINGEIADIEGIRTLLEPGDLLVAADGGARHLLALGLTPHILVGDLDSVDADVVEMLRGRGTVVERHPREKDQTDLELAIERAMREGAQEIVFVGATGGRLDQTLANLLILAQRDWGVPVQLVEGNQSATLLRGPATLELSGEPGGLVSVIPFSPRVTGIEYAGLAYPLHNAVLEFGSTRGISNELLERHASVRLESGLLLVTVERTRVRAVTRRHAGAQGTGLRSGE